MCTWSFKCINQKEEIKHKPMYVFFATGVGSDCLCENREISTRMGTDSNTYHHIPSTHLNTTPSTRVKSSFKNLKLKKDLFD